MDFNSVLNTPVEDIKRPKLPPFGTYKFAVTKVPVIREVKSEKGHWDTIDFPLTAVAPGDDVDMEQLAEYGDLKNVVQSRSFMFPRGDEAGMEKTLYGMKKFVIEHLNVDWPDGTPVKAILPKCVNAVCMGTIAYKPDSKDPEIMHANLTATTSAQ